MDAVSVLVVECEFGREEPPGEDATPLAARSHPYCGMKAADKRALDGSVRAKLSGLLGGARADPCELVRLDGVDLAETYALADVGIYEGSGGGKRALADPRSPTARVYTAEGRFKAEMCAADSDAAFDDDGVALATLTPEHDASVRNVSDAARDG